MRPGESRTSRIDAVRRRNTKLQVGFLAVNPVTVLQALNFYHQNQDARSELSDGAAVRRIQKADFPEQ